MSETVKLHESWLGPLGPQFEQPYMKSLKDFLLAEKAAGRQIFPKGSEWFRALDLTPLEQVRVVILGQDPYHGEGQAHGLCFSRAAPASAPRRASSTSTRRWRRTSASRPRAHGFLEHWAEQGVLLLNSVLTVQMGMAASHQGRGWERFTDAVIRLVNAQADPVVFLLWGSYAQKKAAFVDSIDSGGRHLVLRRRRTSAPALGALGLSSAAAISRRPTRSWRRTGRSRSTGRCPPKS